MEINEEPKKLEEKKEEWLPYPMKWYNPRNLFSWVPFVGKKKSTAKDLMKKTKDGPLLLLMKENKTIEVIEGVEAGKIRFNTQDGKDSEKANKGVLIDPVKKHFLKYGDESIPIYVAYEGEGTCYPSDVTRDSSSLALIFKKVILEYSLLREGEKGGWLKDFLNKYLIYIIFGAGLIYFGYQTGLFDKLAAGVQNIAGNVIHSGANNATATIPADQVVGGVGVS